MAQGYDGYIGFGEHYQGWGTLTHLGTRNFLDPESETLDLGVEERRRDNKIRGERAVGLDMISSEIAIPTGAVVLQPRSDELAALMAAHFQAWDRTGGTGSAGGPWIGTLVFAMVPHSPHFTGSTWGIFNPSDNLFNGGTAVRDIYPLHIWKSLGVPTDTIYDAKIGFDSGIVEQMEWRVTWDTDLVVTPTFSFCGTTPSRAFLHAATALQTNPVSPFNLRFSGWNGTITVDGTANTSLDIEEWNLTTVLGGEARGRIGGYGPRRFPVENVPSDIGGFLMEFKSSKWIERTFSGTGTFAFMIRFQSSATNWVQIDQPHCKFKPITPQITGRDARIDTAFEYEAYGSAGTPPTIVTLHTTLATAGFSLDQNAGTIR